MPVRLDGAVFAAAYAAIAVALLGLVVRLGGRERTLGRSGAVLAAVALVGTAVGAVGLVAAGAPVPFALPVATLALFASALALGAAHLRSGASPRATGVALILFGALTVPLAFLVPAALGGFFPAYALYEAHFLFSGAAWAVVGWPAGHDTPAPPTAPEPRMGSSAHADRRPDPIT